MEIKNSTSTQIVITIIICSYMHVVAQIHTMSFLKIQTPSPTHPHHPLIHAIPDNTFFPSLWSLQLSASLSVSESTIISFCLSCSCSTVTAKHKINLISITISNSYAMVFLNVKLILFIILFTSNVIC